MSGKWWNQYNIRIQSSERVDWTHYAYGTCCSVDEVKHHHAIRCQNTDIQHREDIEKLNTASNSQIIRQRFTAFDPQPHCWWRLVLPQPPVMIDPEAIDPKDMSEANELDAWRSLFWAETEKSAPRCSTTVWSRGHIHGCTFIRNAWMHAIFQQMCHLKCYERNARSKWFWTVELRHEIRNTQWSSASGSSESKSLIDKRRLKSKHL
jgi:hypothetical protein